MKTDLKTEEMTIGNRRFSFGAHTYVMGILNVTPDSFSDGGRYDKIDQALFHAQEMTEAGADILDIGGESTRPGHIQVSDQEEIERVVPVIEAVKQRFDVPVSLDTYKAAVARAGIAAGADLLNDIWGLHYEKEPEGAMGRLTAESGTVCCLMHNRTNPLPGLTPERLMEEMLADAKRALDLGIPADKIILDPGIGFAKTQEENLMVMAHLKQLQEMGYPLLLGASRKSCIDYVLHLPADQRLEGTLATTAYAVEARLAFVRVHDVKEHVRFIRMMEAIRERREG